VSVALLMLQILRRCNFSAILSYQFPFFFTKMFLSGSELSTR